VIVTSKVSLILFSLAQQDGEFFFFFSFKMVSLYFEL